MWRSLKNGLQNFTVDSRFIINLILPPIASTKLSHDLIFFFLSELKRTSYRLRLPGLTNRCICCSIFTAILFPLGGVKGGGVDPYKMIRRLRPLIKASSEPLFPRTPLVTQISRRNGLVPDLNSLLAIACLVSRFSRPPNNTRKTSC